VAPCYRCQHAALRSSAKKLPKPVNHARLEVLVEELRHVARRDVYGFVLDKVPTLVVIVGRLKASQSSVTKEDVRRAIEVGIRSVTIHDEARQQIGLWSFGVPAEARKSTLMVRQAEIGRVVARSASSVRQTDLPALILDLASFLDAAPAGLLNAPQKFRSAFALRAEERHGIRVHSLAMSVVIDPSDYRKSSTTYSGEVEAIKTTDRFRLKFPQVRDWRHGITQRSIDNRLILLPVGHPERYFENEAVYRVTPPWHPGERAGFHIRHRYHMSSRRPYSYSLVRHVVILWDSVSEVVLSVVTPPDTPYPPSWFEEDPWGRAVGSEYQREIPLILETEALREFAVIIDQPQAGSAFGIRAWCPPRQT